MTATVRPRRSALYLPADNPRAVEKARTLGCDVVVLDLEDAVAPARKSQARAAAVAALAGGGFGGREVVVRVNGLSTPWGADDLAAFAPGAAQALILPKISSARELADHAALAAGKPLWAMIETCRGVLALGEIAAAGPAALVVGTNDLAKEMRCRPGADRAPLLAALSLTVTAARAHGLVALDGVCNAIGDPDALVRECRQGADLGFDGKTLIHPSQIAAANAAFSPSREAVAAARRLAAAFDSPENRGKGVIAFEGRMAELLHLEEARRLIATSLEGEGSE